MGDNNDGMYFFNKNNINLMTVNNEYSNIATIYSDRNMKQPSTSDEIQRQCMLMVFQFLR